MHPWGRVYRLGDSLESDHLSGVQDIPFYTKKTAGHAHCAPGSLDQVDAAGLLYSSMDFRARSLPGRISISYESYVR